MGLPYLKVQPEQAIQIIDECIVGGYQIKDKISQAYQADKTKADDNISTWSQMSMDWANGTIQKLTTVFVSQKELYNFRDAPVGFGVTSENIRYVGIIDHLQARIDKLNEYDLYIRNQFNVHVEVVGRDKIIQHGDGSRVETKN